jgi:hypothetical protein
MLRIGNSKLHKFTKYQTWNFVVLPFWIFPRRSIGYYSLCGTFPKYIFQCTRWALPTTLFHRCLAKEIPNLTNSQNTKLGIFHFVALDIPSARHRFRVSGLSSCSSFCFSFQGSVLERSNRRPTQTAVRPLQNFSKKPNLLKAKTWTGDYPASINHLYYSIINILSRQTKDKKKDL